MIKRVICHWTAGTYNVNKTDLEHYHFVIDKDGNVVKGKFSVEDNLSTSDGKYAAHTLNCNTGSIGVAMAGMYGATEKPFNPGKYPITSIQWECMCKLVSDLCTKYNIPVTPTTVLTHAEVEPNLGIKQRGKWDITRIPFMPSLVGAKACGDKLRNDVSYYLISPENLRNIKEEKQNDSNSFVSFIRRLFGWV